MKKKRKNFGLRVSFHQDGRKLLAHFMLTFHLPFLHCEFLSKKKRRNAWKGEEEEKEKERKNVEPQSAQLSFFGDPTQYVESWHLWRLVVVTHAALGCVLIPRSSSSTTDQPHSECSHAKPNQIFSIFSLFFVFFSFFLNTPESRQSCNRQKPTLSRLLLKNAGPELPSHFSCRYHNY